jgi:hypothetical protein
MATADRIMKLFAGLEEAYGCYILSGIKSEKGKAEGKAWTKRELVTLELWKNHVDGKNGIGIIPIRKNNTCLWGSIDIDDYDIDLKTFSLRVYKLGIPLIPFRTKSGGCHLTVFLSEPIAAKDLQIKLAEIAASLGYGRSEIFPKQSKILLDKGDLGNWLNMPYFGGDNGTRYALNSKGAAMRLANFLDYAEKHKISPQDFLTFKLEVKTDMIPDGPPCLQCLTTQGFPQGTRNNGLFALGVYCKKAYPDSWEKELENLNKNCMTPPLESKEVQIILKQLQKKEYNFRCNDQPIASFCNATVCRTRKYGIGGGALPIMKGLRKLPTDQPVWFLEVNNTTLELSTEDLQIQVKFQRVCMNVINYMPPKVTDRQWQGLVQSLMDKCDILEKPKGAGIVDQFHDLLYSFCTDSRLQARSREELLLGRPYTGMDPDDPETPRVFFRIKDLEGYLLRHNFKYYTRSQMSSKLGSDEVGGRTYFFKIKGRGVNVWHIEEPEQQTEEFDLPDMGGDVL